MAKTTSTKSNRVTVTTSAPTKTAPAKTKALEYQLDKFDSERFVILANNADRATGEQSTLIGMAIADGAKASQLAERIAASWAVVGVTKKATSIATGLSQYNSAFKYAEELTVKEFDTIGAIYTACTGKLKVAQIKELVAALVASGHTSDENVRLEFLSAIDAAKGKVTKPADTDTDGDDDDTELDAPDSDSAVTDAAKLIKQLTALVGNLNPESADYRSVMILLAPLAKQVAAESIKAKGESAPVVA